MRRRCTGEDPNLLQYVDPKGERIAGKIDRDTKYTVKSCDCGLSFDDVYRSTVYPHEKI